jgi:hypothetical protein
VLYAGQIHFVQDYEEWFLWLSVGPKTESEEWASYILLREDIVEAQHLPAVKPVGADGYELVSAIKHDRMASI